MSDTWKEDFPVPLDEDSYVTRREFTKFLGLTSLAFFAGTLTAAIRKVWKDLTAARTPEVMVGTVDDIAVGGYKLFRYPTENDPCILLRLEPERFVAFGQNCTHLACPVYFEAAAKRLACPCHKGFFSAETGQPLAGPAKRPLPMLTISVRANQLWARFSEEEYT